MKRTVRVEVTRRAMTAAYITSLPQITRLSMVMPLYQEGGKR
jgi:hypothetical protein